MSEAESSSKIKTHRTATELSSSSLFALLNDDVLQNILARLPALSFASATCVSKLWNRVCNRVLSRPKFASALSLDPCPFVCKKTTNLPLYPSPISLLQIRVLKYILCIKMKCGFFFFFFFFFVLKIDIGCCGRCSW